jgi:acyl CoA:acetate/3-ketoacid CoA transferase alpha subunit
MRSYEREGYSISEFVAASTKMHDEKKFAEKNPPVTLEIEEKDKLTYVTVKSRDAVVSYVLSNLSDNEGTVYLLAPNENFKTRVSPANIFMMEMDEIISQEEFKESNRVWLA